MQVAPTIFTQLFTILGTIKRPKDGADDEIAAIPLVYALLSSKETQQYTIALKAIQDYAQESGIICVPRKLMMDFEKSIINACTEMYPDTSIMCCFFHLTQSVYRKVQGVGLQESYCNPENDRLRVQMHIILALAFVPINDNDVCRIFTRLEAHVDEDNAPVLDNFGETYVIGKPVRGPRRADSSIYP